MLLVLWFMVPLAEFTKGCVQPFLYKFDATKLKVEEDTSTFEAQAKEDKSALEDLFSYKGWPWSESLLWVSHHCRNPNWTGRAKVCQSWRGWTNTTHQKSLELEDLMQLSYSKVEDTAKALSRSLFDIEILFGYMFGNMQFSVKNFLLQCNLDTCFIYIHIL